MYVRYTILLLLLLNIRIQLYIFIFTFKLSYYYNTITTTTMSNVSYVLYCYSNTHVCTYVGTYINFLQFFFFKSCGYTNTHTEYLHKSALKKDVGYMCMCVVYIIKSKNFGVRRASCVHILSMSSPVKVCVYTGCVLKLNSSTFV